MATDIATLGLAIDSSQVDKASRALDGMRRSADRAETAAQKLQRSMSAAARPFMMVQQRIQGLIRTVFSLQGALAGLGVGLVAKSFLDAASKAEQLSVRLRTLLGSVQEGNKLFAQLTDLAGRVPQEYQNIMQAATTLSTVVRSGADDVAKWTEITADIAAAFGMPVEQAAEQMVRALSAGASAADTFREKGVNAFLGFKAGVAVTAEETRKRIIEEWNAVDSSFRGATQRLAQTWEGTMSMLSDKWFQFKIAVMDSGPFEYLKGAFQLIDEQLNLNFENIQKYGQDVGQGLMGAFEAVVIGGARMVDALSPVIDMARQGINNLIGFYNDLPDGIREWGLLGFILIGSKWKLVTVVAASMYETVAKTINQLIADADQAYRDFAKTIRENMPDFISKHMVAPPPTTARMPETLTGLADVFPESDTPGPLDLVRGITGGENTAYADQAQAALDAIRGKIAENRRLAEEQAKLDAAKPKASGGGGPTGDQKILDEIKAMERQTKVYAAFALKTRDGAAAQGELTSAMQLQMEAARKGIDITEGQGQAWYEAKLQLAESKQAFDDMVEAQRKGAEMTERLRTPAESYREALKDINRLLELQVINEKTAARAKEEAAKAFEDAERRKLEASRAASDGIRRGARSYADEATDAAANMEKMTTNAFRNMEDALVEFAQTGKLSFKDMIDSMAADIMRLTVRQNVTGPLAKAIGGFDWGSIFGGGGGGGSASPTSAAGYDAYLATLHSGGVVGRDSSSVRAVNSAVFDGAARYHDGGLIPGEVPIIAQQGERVLTEAQQDAMARTIQGLADMARANAGGGMKVVVNNNAPGTEARARVRQGPSGKELEVVIDERIGQATPDIIDAAANESINRVVELADAGGSFSQTVGRRR